MFSVVAKESDLGEQRWADNPAGLIQPLECLVVSVVPTYDRSHKVVQSHC